jgi:LysM repeat protein
MRALTHVSSFVASLLVAGTAAAGHTSATVRAKAAPLPRSRQALATGLHGRRTTGSSPRERPPEQATSSVVMRTHRIVRGDSLSGIAVLYGTSVQALAAANGLRPEDVIRTGQELVIPQQARPGGGNDWLKYAHSPEHAGHLELVTYKSRFHGVVLEKGRLVPAARRDISELLGATGDRPAVPDRLLRLLVRVSDTFGGRMIRVVSGYRTSSYFADSRHKHSAAIDFSIAGVPNAVVRQYLLMFDDVGVGYYPNSSFVHLDVRNGAMQWVDYAGPGEAPRLRPDAPRFARSPSVSDLDEIAENVAAAMDAAGISRTTSTATHALADAETPAPDALHGAAGRDPGHGDSAHGEGTHGDSAHGESTHETGRGEAPQTEPARGDTAHGETTRGGSTTRETSRDASVRGDSAAARGSHEATAPAPEEAK